MDFYSVLILDSPIDKDKLPKSVILIHAEVLPYSRTLVPYPLLSDSDIFKDNIGVMTRTRGTSADKSASPWPRVGTQKIYPHTYKPQINYQIFYKTHTSNKLLNFFIKPLM